MSIVQNTNPALKQLVEVVENIDGTFSMTLPLGSPIGSIQASEVRNPANAAAILTVPAGKTFNGVAIVVAKFAGAGTVGVSAATGGVLAEAVSSGASATPLVDVVPVTIVGGAGNAVTAVITGTTSFCTVALVGHIA